MEVKLTDTERCQTRYDQLNLIKEKRRKALCHGQLYQQRLKKAFDKKVESRILIEGDLVLKKILPSQYDDRGNGCQTMKAHMSLRNISQEVL